MAALARFHPAAPAGTDIPTGTPTPREDPGHNPGTVPDVPNLTHGGDKERGCSEQPPPGQQAGIWGPKAPRGCFGDRGRGGPHTTSPSPARFALSPDALTAPLHGDGEAPTGAGWPRPHPTNAHTSSRGRNWLPAAPSGPGMTGGQGWDVRGPRWSLGKPWGESGPAGTGTGLG